MRPSDSIESIIHDVASNPDMIGVLPDVVHPTSPAWWHRPKEERNTVYIFAKIPFISCHSSPHSAFAIACVRPEPTKRDRSLIALELHDQANLDVFTSQMPAGAKIVATDMSHVLVECDGFLDDQHADYLRVSDLDSVLDARLLGSYATPLMVDTPSL